MIFIFRWLLFFSLAFGSYRVYDYYFVRVIDIAANVSELPAAEAVAHGVLLQSFNDDGMVRFRLYGKEATVNQETGMIRIFPVNLIVYDDKIEYKQEITILSKEGFYYRESPVRFELNGNVEANIATGLEDLKKIPALRKLFTTRLIYYPKLEKFVSPTQFKIVDTTNNSITTGRSFTYHQSLQKGEIEGPMEMRMHEEPTVVLEEMSRGFVSENRS